MSNRRKRSIYALGLVLLLIAAFTVTLVAVLPHKTPSQDDSLFATGRAGLQVDSPDSSPSFFTFVPPTPGPVPHAAAAPASSPRPKPKPIVCPASPVIPYRITTAGLAQVSKVPVYSAPNGSLVRTLSSPTRDSMQLAVLVRGRTGDWLKVQYAERPNGTTGWIKADTMELFTSDEHVLVEKCRHRLTVYKKGQPVFQVPVAVGKSNTPTPIVETFVDFVWKSDHPRGSYGPYMLSLAAFSEVLHSFGDGGVGQIAMHGTNARSSVGRSSSNGCVRMYNEDVARLVNIVGTGVPVTIAP